MRLPVTAAMKRRALAALEPLRHGRLTLTTPEGVYEFGQGDGPHADMTVRDWCVVPAMLARADIGLGETFVEQHWHSEDLEKLLTLFMRNIHDLQDYANPGPLSRIGFVLLDRVMRNNSLSGSSRNIRAHYDVGNEFYQLWLDPGMTYSSALFAPGDSDLERAQQRKNDRILSRLSEGEQILEIGCGWGGFAERAAEKGRHVTGLTLSPSQKGYADARLDGRADIRLQDYRHSDGKFDNIVSIEMIEAVGERWWPSYFATLKARLKEGGRAVLQAITVPDTQFSIYRAKSDYIRHHVFPGGLLPCHAAMASEGAKAGLTLQDTFSFGQDYAQTCRIWAQRMKDQKARIVRLGYDERFLRGWQFYLECCAAAFATGRTDVVHVEFAHA